MFDSYLNETAIADEYATEQAKLYVGTDEDLRRDLLIVTGLANFDLLWDEKRELLKHGF